MQSSSPLRILGGVNATAKQLHLTRMCRARGAGEDATQCLAKCSATLENLLRTQPVTQWMWDQWEEALRAAAIDELGREPRTRDIQDRPEHRANLEQCQGTLQRSLERLQATRGVIKKEPDPDHTHRGVLPNIWRDRYRHEEL